MDISLMILNILMRKRDYVSTKQLIDIIGCERKAIYNNIAKLEICGFPIIVKRTKQGNWYKYSGEVMGF